MTTDQGTSGGTMGDDSDDDADGRGASSSQDLAGETASRSSRPPGTIASRSLLIVAVLVVVMFVAWLVFGSVFAWMMGEPVENLTRIHNATDRTVSVERRLGHGERQRWEAVVELGPDEEVSETDLLGCHGTVPVRALDRDGEVVDEVELRIDSGCGGRWVIEADG